MPGQAGVEGQQQVEALLGPDLADDDPARPHPQALADQVAQVDLAGALEPGLPGLQRHPVGVREPELEDLLRADTTRSPPGIAAARQFSMVVLPAWVPPATRMLRPARTLASRKAAARAAQAAQLDEVGEPGRLQHELADVDGLAPAADALEHDVQAMSLRQHGVDERAAQIHSAATRLEHPLDQLVHLRTAQHQVGQLVTAVPGHEDPRRVVDPDLFDRGVVEERLQRPEPRDPRHQLADDRRRVGHRRDDPGQTALVVVTDHAFGDAAYDGRVALRVDALMAHGLAHEQVELVHQLGMPVAVDSGCRHAAPLPR